MTKTKKLINLLCMLSALLLAQTHVAHADLIAYERWYNPQTGQTIHEFHDVHISPIGFADKIKQQADIVAAAKKIDAHVIVEDHLTWHKRKLFDLGLEARRPLGRFKNPFALQGKKEEEEYFKEWQKVYRGTPEVQYGKQRAIQFDSTIYGLEELCKKARVPVTNIENRVGVGCIQKEAIALIDKNIIEAIEKNKVHKNIFLAAGFVHIQNVNQFLKANGYECKETIINSSLKQLLELPINKAIKEFFIDLFNVALKKTASLEKLSGQDIGTIITHQINVASLFKDKPAAPVAPAPTAANAAQAVAQQPAGAQKGAAAHNRNADPVNVKHGAEVKPANNAANAAAPVHNKVEPTLFAKQELFKKTYNGKSVDLLLGQAIEISDKWKFNNHSSFVRGEVIGATRGSNEYVYGIVLSCDNTNVVVQVGINQYKTMNVKDVGKSSIPTKNKK